MELTVTIMFAIDDLLHPIRNTFPDDIGEYLSETQKAFVAECKKVEEKLTTALADLRKS